MFGSTKLRGEDRPRADSLRSPRRMLMLLLLLLLLLLESREDGHFMCLGI